MSAALLAFGPIYVALVAFGLGVLLIASLGRRPGSAGTERAAETDRRGGATGPLIDELEGSVEKRAELLVRMGLEEIEWITDEPTPGVIAFHVRNPMPMSGGTYLVHFAKRAQEPVDSARVQAFRKTVKSEEGILKGIFVTSGAFTVEAWQAAETAPIELVDGKRLVSLLQMFYPDRFPKERL